MAEEQEISGRAILAGLAFMAVTGVGAIFILLTPRHPRAPEPAKPAAAAPAAPVPAPPRPKLSVFDSARTRDQQAASGIPRRTLTRELGTYADSSSPKPFMEIGRAHV